MPTSEQVPLDTLSDTLNPNPQPSQKNNEGSGDVSNESETDDLQTTEHLSRFGLQNASNVTVFLKTPEGEKAITEILAEKARLDAMHAEQQMQLQEQNLLLYRFISLLALLFISEKASAAKQNDELVLQQIDKVLKNGAKSTNSTATKTESPSRKELQESIIAYDRALKDMAQEQEEKSVRTGDLEKVKTELASQGEQLKEKHETYASHVDSIEQWISTHERNLTPEEIDGKIQTITNEMDVLTDQIGEKLEKNDEVGARKLLNIQVAMNLQIATLYDIHPKHNPKKYYANEKGEKVDSFKQAHFVLDRDKKIVKDKDNGQCYLLNAEQTLETMNDEAKNNARQDYKRSKQDLFCVKKLISHHEKKESSIHKTQVDDNASQIRENESAKRELANQIKLLQSARASAEHLLSQPNLERATPRPTVSGGSASTPKPTNQASATVVYRKYLQNLLSEPAPTLTREQLFKLANQAPGTNKNVANTFLNVMSRSGSNNQVAMQFLLKNMAQFGIEAPILPDANPPKNDSATDEKKSYESPTPFNMNPTNKRR